MSIVSFPYRWSLRTVFKNIDHAIWDIRNGIRNIRVFFSAVWWFRSWDWTGLAELIEVSAREMRNVADQGIHDGADRSARQLLIVQQLAKRLREDNYAEKCGYGNKEWESLPDHRRSQIFKHISYMEKQDAIYLGKMFRFLQHWWE